MTHDPFFWFSCLMLVMLGISSWVNWEMSRQAEALADLAKQLTRSRFSLVSRSPMRIIHPELDEAEPTPIH